VEAPKGVEVKIAVVSGDDVSGEDTQQFCTALAAQGDDITAYVRRWDGRRAGSNTQRSYQVVPMRIGPDAVVPARDVLPFVSEWAARLERLWSSQPPVIVHAHGWLGGLAAQLAARRQSLPTVQSFYGLAVTSREKSADHPHQEYERQCIEPLLARNATWVTAESNSDVDALAKLRHSRAQLSVLAGGVDVDRYTPVGPALARTELHRILGLAPNPLSCNGFDTLIRALPRIPDTELVVAETDATDHGNDAARAELRKLASALGVADRVRLPGTVAGDQLPKLLRSADVVACTPREPPRAATVLRAMASGVAVIALPVGILDDVVVHGVTGLVLAPNNPGELVAALKHLPAQRFQCQSMGAAGRNRALSRFTWERAALESVTVYRRLSSPYSAPRHRGTAAAARMVTP
jgi:glycosyltransferase involved in cell wall biosynthesis